ncbi:MAG: alpha/beta fold hydrolase [Prevotellaceae bacterium]|jgi:homoserine O-acetyltransferase|nr:alpha/beta fold hydrolase [Prevotellaceae bacterium]
MSDLQKIIIENYLAKNAKQPQNLILSYQIFGCELGTAPVVLVNHALTGNSNVIGKNGWWNELIGENGAINPQNFTILAFNIPGNAFCDDENLIENYKDFTIFDIAKIFWQGIDYLHIDKIFAAIGSSLGGAIAWEMAAQRNDKIGKIIPIATDWKSTAWLLAHVLLQDRILNNSANPIFDARIHGMLLYRTPQSLQARFDRGLQPDNPDLFQIESWFCHHGEKLEGRFALSAYKLMNYLLRTIDITQNRGDFLAVASKIQSEIHFVSIDTDLFFPANITKSDYENLKKIKQNVFYHEIKSIHGHDAFLIEYQQLNDMLKDVFE